MARWETLHKTCQVRRFLAQDESKVPKLSLKIFVYFQPLSQRWSFGPRNILVVFGGRGRLARIPTTFHTTNRHLSSGI